MSEPTFGSGDSIFEQLFALLQSSGPVNWKLAREVTKSLAGPAEPIDPNLAEEYRELGTAAALRLDACSRLPAGRGALLHPVDRSTWTAENQQAFRILVEPLAEKFDLGDGGPMGDALGYLGPALLGIQAGTMVGFMAHRALGQFDTGIPSLEHDRAYLVVPNVEEFALVHQLDARQVRLWAALHELAFHRLMGIPWLRGYFVGIVGEFYETVSFDVTGLLRRLGDLEDPGELERLLDADSSGVPSLLRGEVDGERLDRVRAFVAVLGGYGDHLTRRAGAVVLPDLDRIEEAHRRQRTETDQALEFLRQLAGLDLPRALATTAAEFCAEVERRWGAETLDAMWDDPAKLPNRHELTDPVGWAARTLL
ncbi:MAG TPA: hypothetical protein ENK55_02770 [Actinobacteria bacterium]|nr:hypothetical protein [Actinomycetota bacterium]